MSKPAGQAGPLGVRRRMVDPNSDRPSYVALSYDRATSQVLSLSGPGHDFTGAVPTLGPSILIRPTALPSFRRRITGPGDEPVQKVPYSRNRAH